MIEEIRCPLCKKLIGKKETETKLDGIYFWCPRCKKNLDISRKKIIEI